MPHDVELFPVLFTRKDAEQKEFFELLERLHVRHVTYVNTRKRRYRNLLRNLLDALSVFRRARFDVLHCHGYRADLLGFVASRLFGTPIIATVHGFTPTDRYLRFYRQLDLWLLRRFDRVIAVSARMKDDLVAHGLRPESIEVVTNAVAEPDGSARQTRAETRARLGIDPSAFVFGFVGRLSEEKGLDFFLRAMSGLPNCTNGKYRAILVGEGPERSRLEHTVNGLGLAGNVDFVGFQTDTSAWYAAMDAFVLPSLTEGTPVALLEAMAHQVPVIASAVGGVPAIVCSRSNGILVPPGDAPHLLEAMRTVSNSAELRTKLSDAGLRSIRGHFTIEAWTQNMRRVYDGAVCREGQRR
jgi:L-malate glycosyltransferase